MCNGRSRAAWGTFMDRRQTSNVGLLLPMRLFCSCKECSVGAFVCRQLCTVTARESSSILLSTASTLVPMECVVDRRSTAVLSQLQ